MSLEKTLQELLEGEQEERLGRARYERGDLDPVGWACGRRLRLPVLSPYRGTKGQDALTAAEEEIAD
ncbi:MAG TPA: hypothetical protein VM163_07850 [bacterium]|nr:hypothetical protein [bacterium]